LPLKKSLFPLVFCAASFVLGVPGVSARQKSKKPPPTVYQAMLRSPQLKGAWPLEITIDELSTGEEIQGLAQTYATGGERALDKAMDRLRKGYADLGSYRMPIMFVRSTSDGPNRRIDILAKFPLLTPLSNIFADMSGYAYVYMQLQVDGRGIGRGSLTPKTRIAFNPQGQMTLATHASEPSALTLVHEVK
jgi:hypothetical protein